MRTGRYVSLLLTVLLTGSAMNIHPMLQPAGAEQLTASAGQILVHETQALTGPVTVQTTVRFPEVEDLELDGIWAAGLSVAPQGLPTTLSVAWVKETDSWFGPVWKLCLATDRSSAPRDLFSDTGRGILEGQSYLTLVSALPEAGHLYEVALGYDPITGATSVLVYDKTSGKAIVSRGLQLPAFAAPLYAGAGFRLPSDGDGPEAMPVFESLHTSAFFTPAEVNWSLVEVNRQNQTVPTNVVNRTKDVRLLVRMPWKRITGELRLLIRDGKGNTRVFPIVNPTNETLIPLALADFHAGEYQMALEYVTNGHSIVLNERTVQVGIVAASLEGVQINRVNASQVAVVGEVVLQGDGAIDLADLNLDLRLEALSLSIDDASWEGKITGAPAAAKQVLAQQLPMLDVTPVRVKFSGSLELSQAPLQPYRIWRITLEPAVLSDAALQANNYQTLLRVPSAVGLESPEKKPEQGIRVMTYNMHAGYGLDDTLDLQRLADVMAYSGAQIIGLNEVDQATRRSGYVDQAAKLANILGMHVAYGPNIYYQGGQYGNAILSRFPIVSAKNISLPGMGGEKRGVLHAQIDIDGVLTHVLVTHLGLTSEENTLQLKYIAKLTSELLGPVILLGDFNMAAGTNADPGPYLQQNLRDAWQVATELSKPGSPSRPASFGKTINSLTPQRRIDYIFISSELEVSEGAFTINSQASDHRPVVVELNFKSK